MAEAGPSVEAGEETKTKTKAKAKAKPKAAAVAVAASVEPEAAQTPAVEVETAPATAAETAPDAAGEKEEKKPERRALTGLLPEEDQREVDVRLEAMRACAAEKGKLQTGSGKKHWALALGALVDKGEIDTACYIAPQLADAYPGVQMIQAMAPMLERLPPPIEGDETFTSFVDDLSAAVQIVKREGASTLVLGFAGLAGKMNLPLSMMHRIFAPANVHVAYIRIQAWAPVGNGPTLGRSMEKVFASIGKIIDEINPTRVVAQGHSGGGLGATLSGLKLGYDRMLLFSPPVSADRSNNIRRLAFKTGLGEDWTLVEAYRKAKKQVPARIVYAAGHQIDAAQAKMMDGVPGVTLEAVEGEDDHNVFMPTYLSGRYKALLTELVDETPA